ncbi:hypothetical protein N7475_000714 [Penicillium sp. IBT 31633x]|nr:hypothetical protein N7475_000714 [Penicillium sp. IBT 31633x]
MASKDRLQDRDLPFPWRNRDESGKAKARKAMDGILKAVTVFREMGSAVASLDPSHAGVAWAGLVLGGAEQNAAALEGLAEISLIITRYAKIEDVYFEQRQKGEDTSLKQDFRSQIVDLDAKILMYQIAIISHSKRRSILQYARAIPRLDEWEKLLEDILRVDAECRKFTQIFDSQGIVKSLNPDQSIHSLARTEQMTQHHELKDILEEQDQQMEIVSRQLDGLYEQTQEHIDRADQQSLSRSSLVQERRPKVKGLISTKHTLSGPRTRSNTSPGKPILVSNNPSTDIILSTVRLASKLTQPCSNITAHINILVFVRRDPTRHRSIRPGIGRQINRGRGLIFGRVQIINDTTQRNIGLITDMNMNLFLGARGDTIHCKRSCSPDMSIPERILTQPEPTVRVSSGAQL